MATLSEICTLTSRTYVAEKPMTNPNLSETLRLLSHTPPLLLWKKKASKMLDFDSFFSLKNISLSTLI